VLFSNPKIAEYINANFEPSWQSVRAVPTVSIDFGNGKVERRTLNGNIATYACASDGQVLDVLPGIYDPANYYRALEQLSLLYTYVTDQGPLRLNEPLDKSVRQAVLQDYHVRQQQLLAQRRDPLLLVESRSQGVSKMMIESPIKILLMPSPAQATPLREAMALREKDVNGDATGWKTLIEDSRINEGERRRCVHEMLAAEGQVQPVQISKRIYKEILHADLDDPYLGLGHILFAHYPFHDGASQ